MRAEKSPAEDGVIDLMDALERSVREAREANRAAREATGCSMCGGPVEIPGHDTKCWGCFHRCGWPLAHRDRHVCGCVCRLPKGHDGRHQCEAAVTDNDLSATAATPESVEVGPDRAGSTDTATPVWNHCL